MSEFNLANWRDAISKVYTRSVSDDGFRQLCFSDPRAAVAAVSDIDLPADLVFNFVATHQEITYSFLLPPALGAAAPPANQVKQIIDWTVYCTDPTTR